MNVRTPPVVVLGVSRSGTTLLKEMLDRHSRLAIPTESYFIPQLWHRHGDRPDPEAFRADLARLQRVREWGGRPEELSLGPTFAECVQAVYRAYAESQGKERFGDKTPAYMQHLDLLEQAFPGAQYVHLIRDGRDAALSFTAMRRRPRFNWARPRALLSFACQWRTEVEGARRFAPAGRYHELRYEDLVADPEGRLREVCAFLGLDFEPAMLDYHRDLARERLVDHPKLAEPPGAGRSRWREQLSPAEVERFEAVAGDLLAELGYERAFPKPSPRARARAAAEQGAFATRRATWDAALGLVRRTPAWRARQVYIRRTAQGQSPE
jgi:hypothetical protein